MARYVKFYRGTPDAFNKLAEKNADTLYFIAEPDAVAGSLYLGSKLISNGPEDAKEDVEFSTLEKLKDVLITEGLSDESFLVYDKDVNAWTNKPLEDLEFIGATSRSAGLSGLVPAPELGQTDLFLRSDGEWATPIVDHTVLTLENKDKSAHIDLLTTALTTPLSGDIVIIKDFLYDDKWQYTAYVFDNSNWHAMDGNYDASNVYFNEDLTTTTAIGNITLKDGQAIIPAAGKNLKEVFEAIFVKEKNPSTNQPYISLTFNQAGAYEVGTNINPSYTATFNSGSYTYGPPTGVTATGWEAVDTNGNKKSLRNGTFPSFTVTDTTDYYITVTATHSSGDIPVTNLGNDYVAGKITAGSVEKISGSVTGYRNGFSGTFNNKNSFNSDKIRSLKPTDRELANGDSITVHIPVGAYRVVFAYPSYLRDLSSVKDKNGLEAEILSGFSRTVLDVEGENEYSAIEYKVYYIDYANANDADNYYTFKI